VFCILLILIRYFGNFYYNFPLIVLFAARYLDRITEGNISLADAYLADISKDIYRSKTLANYQNHLTLGLSLAQH
jgi:hypothetical protein